MADGEKKRLVWAIMKDLLTVSADELFQTAKSVAPVQGMDQSHLKLGVRRDVLSTVIVCSNSLL